MTDNCTPNRVRRVSVHRPTRSK